MSALSSSPGVLHLPQVSLTDANWESGLGLLLSHVRPGWAFASVRQRVFTDGITNKLVALHLGEKIFFGDDVILVRIYGEKTDLIIDRQAEVRNMQLLHQSGFCEPLYATFSNGLCYGFAHGDVADEDLVRDPTVARLIARELASLHCLRVHPDVIPNQTPGLFATMRRWLDLGPDAFDEPERQARFRAVFPVKAELRADLDDLEFQLSRLPDCPIVFSHNDTLIKNFVYNRREQRIRLIDFEYCAFNYQPFDLANHFNEFAGVATVDHARYPTREFQLPWLRCYLGYRDALLGNSRGDADLDARAELLYSQVTRFSLASHLFWSLWALVQARHSAIDFDFLEYAISRYSEYRDKRAQRLAT